MTDSRFGAVCWLRAALVMLALCLCVIAPLESAQAAVPYSDKDWMKYLPDSMPISEINMPGTHDSGTTHIKFENWSCCQDKDILEQMNIGMRVFDIRLGAPTSTPDDAMDLYLYHGGLVCFKYSFLLERLNLRDCVEWAQSFLKDHPSETIVFNLASENDKDKDYEGKKNTPQRIRELIRKYRFKDRTDDQFIVTFQPGEDEVPSLGDVRGKLVIINDTSGDWPRTYTQYEMAYHLDKNLGGKISNKVNRIIQLFTTPTREGWHIDYTGLAHWKWPVFRSENYSNVSGQEGNPDVKYIGTNVTNKDGNITRWFGHGPEWCADEFYGSSRIKNIQIARGYRYGWITMDFPEKSPSFTKKIILSNFDNLIDYVVTVETPIGAKCSVDAWRISSSDNYVQLKVSEPTYKEENGKWIYTAVAYAQPRYDEHNNLNRFEAEIYIDTPGEFGIQLVSSEVVQLDYDLNNSMGAEYELREKYAVVTDSKPFDAQLTIHWGSYADVNIRPSELSDFLAMFGGALPFEVQSAKSGNQFVYAKEKGRGPGAYIEEYYLDKRENTSTMVVRNLPTVDSVGSRYIYLRACAKAVPHYVIESYVDRYRNTFDVYMTYDLPVGYQEVTVNVNWCDGGNTYGLRERAVDTVSKFNFSAGYVAKQGLSILPNVKPVGIDIVNKGEAIKYTLNENDGGREIDRHIFTAPKLTNYRTEIKTSKFFSVMGGNQHEITAFATAILQGTFDVTVTWVGDTPATRPNVSVGVYTSSGDVSLNASNKTDDYHWRVTGIPYDAYTEDNQEVRLNENSRISVSEVPGYRASVIATPSPKTIGSVPHYDVEVILSPSKYMAVNGEVTWRDGDLTFTHRTPILDVYQMYLRDPKGEIEDDNIVEKAANVTRAHIVWEGDRYHFENNEEFPYYADNGSAAVYRVDTVTMPNYLKEIVDWNIIYTRSVSISGSVTWFNGDRPSNREPQVMVRQNGKPYGDLVDCENFQYAIYNLPLCDENNVPYEYTIEAVMLGFDCTMVYSKPERKSNGNVIHNVTIYPNKVEAIAEVPIRLNLVNADPETNADVFTFRLECTSDSSVPDQTIQLSNRNGFAGTFEAPLSPQAGRTYTFEVKQLDVDRLPYWEYDKTIAKASATVQFLNGKPVALVDAGENNELRFTNVYKPTPGTASIQLKNRVINQVAGIAEAPEIDFIYQLSEVMPDGTEVAAGYTSRTGEGKLEFPSITYKKAGEYKYRVLPLAMDMPGWRFDEVPQDVVIKVTDKGGKLEAKQDIVPEFKNIFISPTKNINVGVRWVDNGRSAASRPTSLNIQLMENGTGRESRKLTAEDSWKWVFPNIPTYGTIGGKTEAINYTLDVQSLEDKGYSVRVEGSAAEGFVVTCTAMISVSGTVDWENGRRPSINQPTVLLLRNGQMYGAPMQTTDYKYAFTNLPLASEQNDPYTYSIIAELPNQPCVIVYDQVQKDTTTGNLTANATIRSTDNLTPMETRVELKLQNTDTSKETETFTFLLEGETDQGLVRKQVTLSRENEFIGSFIESLALSGGKTYPFTMRQVSNESPYWTYDNRVAEATVTKRSNGAQIQWSMLDDNGKMTAVEFPVFTNKRVTTEAFIEAEVDWLDDGMPATLRPENVAVTLVGDGKTSQTAVLDKNHNWRHTFADAPIYRPGVKPLTPIQYTLSAPEVPGYACTMIGDAKEGFAVTYTAMLTVSGTVDWKDGKRPANNQPMIQLLRNGEKIGPAISAEDFQYSFTNQPAADRNGVPYAYSIQATLPGFTATITHQSVTRDENGNFIANAVIHQDQGEIPVEVPVQLTLKGADPATEPESFFFEMTGDTREGTYDAILQLNRENGFAGSFVFDGTLLKAGTDYTFTVKQLPGTKPVWDYDERIQEVKITVRSLNGGKPQATVIMGGAPAVRFTNTRLKNSENISVTARWNNGGRTSTPAQTTIQLFGDGVKVREAELEALTGWQHTFVDLPLYRETLPRAAVEYSIYCKAPAGYTVNLTGDASTGFVATYTAQISISGKVDWENSKRPQQNQPVVYLLRNGELTGDVVTAKDFRYAFTNLPATDEGGRPYEYSILAMMPSSQDGKHASILYQAASMDSDGNFHADAIIRQDKEAIQAQTAVFLKLDGIDPAELSKDTSFVFELESQVNEHPYRDLLILNRDNVMTVNGKEVLAGFFTMDASWMTGTATYPFTIRQVNGHLDGWQYDENSIRNVKLSLKSLNGSKAVYIDGDLNFKNTYRPLYAQYAIQVDKWITNLLTGAAEPPVQSFRFELYEQNGNRETRLSTVNLNGEGHARFPEMAASKAGTYNYVVREVGSAPSGWIYDLEPHAVKVVVTDDHGQLKATAEEATIINTFKTTMLDIGVQIAWVDNNPVKKPIPDSVAVTLLADGEAKGTANLSKPGWAAIFEHMPEYRENTLARAIQMVPVVYTLNAADVPGFTKTVSGDARTGFTVTYTATKDLPVTGDSTNLPLLAGMLVLSLSAIAVLLRKRRNL